MKRTLATIPSGHQVGLTTVSMGLVRALSLKGYNVGFFKPIAQPMQGSRLGLDQSSLILERCCGLHSPHPIGLEEAEALLRKGEDQVLMEKVAENYNRVASERDIVVVEGMVTASDVFFAKRLNSLIIETLDAEVILVSAVNGRSPEEVAEAVEIQTREYSNDAENAVIGCVINKIGKPEAEWYGSSSLPPASIDQKRLAISPERMNQKIEAIESALESTNMVVLAAIPYMGQVASPRLRDFANALDAHPIRQGDWIDRRVSCIALMGQGLLPNLPFFKDGALVVCSADRADVLIAAALAEMNGVTLAGILLCNGMEPDPKVWDLMEPALAGGLPIFGVARDLFSTTAMIADLKPEIPLDDREMALQQMDAVATRFKETWIDKVLDKTREHRTSPAAFRHFLIQLASRSQRTIVLPEGDEPRTVEAAIHCYQRGIAKPLLLAPQAKVEAVAAELGMKLPAGIDIIDPDSLIDELVAPMMELRKAKGLTEEKARELLSDSIYVGTMLLQQGRADGLVSGAVHTSANTVKPALQLIKTRPGVDTVNSIFFMCLPNQVLIYGDCAIVQDPTAEQLASIAIQSADSAKYFNIPQRVAMVSYSTGESGTGADVEKVKEATALVKKQRPDIAVDGPLQYDAAVIESVAQKKAPNSPIAGKATVLIFPDLNTGNITYKAVQRSAHVVSIGPMLQGLRKPVNNLSRGALVDDIIYTIALTAIQAQQSEDNA